MSAKVSSSGPSIRNDQQSSASENGQHSPPKPTVQSSEPDMSTIDEYFEDFACALPSVLNQKAPWYPLSPFCDYIWEMPSFGIKMLTSPSPVVHTALDQCLSAHTFLQSVKPTRVTKPTLIDPNVSSKYGDFKTIPHITTAIDADGASGPDPTTESKTAPFLDGPLDMDGDIMLKTLDSIGANHILIPFMLSLPLLTSEAGKIRTTVRPKSLKSDFEKFHNVLSTDWYRKKYIGTNWKAIDSFLNSTYVTKPHALRIRSVTVLKKREWERPLKPHYTHTLVFHEVTLLNHSNHLGVSC
jgi:hypothetical protein